MKLIRVINISNKAVTIKDTVIYAHKVVDFIYDELSKGDLEDIAAYSAVGVVRAFEYDKHEVVIPEIDTNSTEISEEVTTPKRSRKK